MDGKKRIARLRNAEKWRNKGFGAPPLKREVVDKQIAAAQLEEKRVEKIVEILNNFVPKDVPVKEHWDWDAGEMRWVKIPQIGEAAVKLKPLECPYAYGKWLVKKGWKRLGNGVHSTVYGRDNSEKVIKVTATLDNWIDYVQWASKAGYAGNLAPRVYSWKRRGNWAVAVVEKMHTGGYNADGKLDGTVIQHLIYPARKGNVLAKLYMEDACPGSVAFFDDLSRLGYDGDMGGNNLMYRKDGTLCVTDPCAGRIQTAKKRLRSGDLSPSLYELMIGVCDGRLGTTRKNSLRSRCDFPCNVLRKWAYYVWTYL